MHIDVATAEPERPGDPVLSASAGDAVASMAPVSSPTPRASTQFRSTPLNQQEAGEGHPTAAITTVAATLTKPSPPVGESADPKISGLYAISLDRDAATLRDLKYTLGLPSISYHRVDD